MAMNLRPLAVFLASLPLVACDKSPSGDKAHPTDDSGSGAREGPLATRVDRLRKDQPPSQNQRLRDSLDQAKDIEEPQARAEALAKLAWGALDSDPDFFTRVFDALPSDSAERSSLIQAQVAKLAQENPDTALQWATSLETPQEKEVAKNEIIQFLAGSDPKRATQVLGRPPSGESELDNTTLYVIHRLSADAPVEAASWVVTFPAGKARETAMATVASDWVQADTKSALSWLTTLNNPVLRNEAIQGILEAIADQPDDIKEQWLENATPSVRREIDLQLERINPPAPEEEPLPEAN